MQTAVAAGVAPLEEKVTGGVGWEAGGRAAHSSSRVFLHRLPPLSKGTPLAQPPSAPPTI